MRRNKSTAGKKSAVLALALFVAFLFFISKTRVAVDNYIESSQEKTADVAPQDDYAEERRRMVDAQIRARGISDRAVLEAMEKVPRHEFVPRGLRSSAYSDRPLPIGYGQTISQPYIVALMTQSLSLNRSHKVLEIGTGSGYQAAVLTEIAKDVYTVEIIEELASSAEKRLRSLGYSNVRVRHGDGYYGWEEYAPFDAIIVTAAANHIPPPLIKQLKNNGRLVIPLGSTSGFQTLTLVTKKNNTTKTRFITGVRFVPFVGKAQERAP